MAESHEVKSILSRDWGVMKMEKDLWFDLLNLRTLSDAKLQQTYELNRTLLQNDIDYYRMYKRLLRNKEVPILYNLPVLMCVRGLKKSIKRRLDDLRACKQAMKERLEKGA